MRESFPPISRPLPALLRGLEYDNGSPVIGRKEISTFEESSSYDWIYKLWANVMSTKWASHLLPGKAQFSSRTNSTVGPQSYSLSSIDGPSLSLKKGDSGGLSSQQTENYSGTNSRPKTLPDVSRLSWTDWQVGDLIEVGRSPLQDKGTSSTYIGVADVEKPSLKNDVFKRLIIDSFLTADDLDEIDLWNAEYEVDEDFLWKAVDCNLFKTNPPAWETLAYLSEEGCGIDAIRQLYDEGQKNINMLGAYLSPSEIDNHRVSLALWRVWTYCILSIESMMVGECIAVQVAWLRGAPIDANRALLCKPRLKIGKTDNWKLRRTNGIFAHGNNNLHKRDAKDMIQIWNLLGQKCSETMVGNDSNGLQDQFIMHIFSRATGPKDILDILKASHHSPISFQEAFRIKRWEGNAS